MTGIKMMNHNIDKTYEWLNEIEGYVCWQETNHDRAFTLLRAVLQEIRDHIPINSLAHFSAQLPLIIRGILFESWNPEHNHIKQRKLEDFITSISQRLPKKYQHTNIETDIRAVLTTLSNKVDYNEFEKLFRIFPKNIRELAKYPVD